MAERPPSCRLKSSRGCPARAAVETALAAGFDTVSIDLTFGQARLAFEKRSQVRGLIGVRDRAL